jgi:hypothetical protein
MSFILSLRRLSYKKRVERRTGQRSARSLYIKQPDKPGRNSGFEPNQSRNSERGEWVGPFTVTADAGRHRIT